MNRRQFIRIGSATAAAAAVPLTSSIKGPLGEFVLVEPASVAASVHVLGPEPTTPDQRFFKGLSDDVFERLRSAFREKWSSRTMRVVVAEDMGDAVLEGVLQFQWNTSYKLHASFTSDRPPYFPIDHFRWATNRWITGSCMCPEFPVYGDWSPPSNQPVPIAEMFGKARIVGMPRLPHGLIWQAHYIDEDTGLVMRAVASYEVQMDEYLARWDVIVG